jgi:hypothetical protein
MNYGSPLTKDQKKQKTVIEEEKPLEKFKPEKPFINKSNARQLSGVACDTTQMLWLQRWLEQLVRERSYPPQIAGKEPFFALTQFLTNEDCIRVLETLRLDFQRQFPSLSVKEEGDFDFLLAMEQTLQHQRTSLSCDHNTLTQDACD